MIRILRLAAVLAGVLLAGCGQQGAQDAEDRLAQGPAAPAAFATCASCHSLSPGRNAAGPSLAGIWGKQAGSSSGYMYSAALKNSGIVWDERTMDRWLQGPMQMVPGTRMVIGVPDPQARQAVIAYLKQLK